METAIAEVKELLNKLLEESSFEDIQYHLYVIAKIQRGLARAENEGAIPHDDVEKQFSQWLSN
jgi:predicted transcriptional regulator